MTVRPRMVLSKEANLTRSDSSAVKLFTLPRECYPLRVTVFTAAASGGATCDVGVYGNTDSYIDGLDVSGEGASIGTLLDRTKTTEPTDVYGLIGGAPGSGGPFTVIMEYTYTRYGAIAG